MDPRDTPGYRLHRARSHLHSIDLDAVPAADRDRLRLATTLLESVTFVTFVTTVEDD
jgi:hypothetical protein